MARYSLFQSALQASILVHLYKAKYLHDVTVEKLRQECPSLVHDVLTDEDFRLALSKLSWEGCLDFDLSGDSDPNEVELPDGYDEMSEDERWQAYEEARDKDFIISLESIIGISLNDYGVETVGLRRKTSGDILRKISRMEDEEVEDYFENLLSEFDHLEPIRYTDPAKIVDLNRNPKVRDEIVDQLTKLTMMIQTSNSVMSMKSAELEKAISDIKAGTEMVKAGKFTIGKIEGVLFGALGYLTSKFADAPIGDAAQFCWGLIKSACMHFAI
jgi:hypothetical protein